MSRKKLTRGSTRLTGTGANNYIGSAWWKQHFADPDTSGLPLNIPRFV
jgi:hypothetical protein